ncbi:MAG TPA: antibiotic biosynthesis monooxygenase family protein [Mycobacteriales bacterium]|nr:antibiotic biosynthesis monooxygenase family protein [Mycobacteriales bacterium]
MALIDVAPGAEAAFGEAFLRGRGHLAGSVGCRSVRMTQGVETPTRFVLLVEWDSIEAHQAFRASAAFPAWREEVGPHFAVPPRVEHFTDV